jgi:hypothetical protein
MNIWPYTQPILSADAENSTTTARQPGEIQSWEPWTLGILRLPTRLLRRIHRKVREETAEWQNRPGLFAVAGADSDPLRLIGAAIIGAGSQWIFNRVVKKSPPPGSDPHNKRVLAELRHIREQIQLIQGDVQGLSRRIGSLERAGAGD